MSALTGLVVFTAGELAYSAQVDLNFTLVKNAVNTIDNTNMGPAGIYALSIIPTTGSQATFGGTQAYTFPSGITLPGNGGLALVNGTSNLIQYNMAGVAAPTFTTRSVGTKIVLYPNLGAHATDFALGISGATLWNSVPTTGAQFQWYAGTGIIATLSGGGGLSLSGGLAATTGTFSSNISGADIFAARTSTSGVYWFGSSTADAEIDYNINYPGGMYFSTKIQSVGTVTASTAGFALNGTAASANMLTDGANLLFRCYAGGSTYFESSAGDEWGYINATNLVLVGYLNSGAGVTANGPVNGVTTLTTSGAASIGTSLAVAGAITCSVLTQTSDVSLKENVVEIPYGLETVKALRPVAFDWIEDKTKAVGFIAQEVQPLVPEVTQIDEGLMGINYSGIVPILVKALQELSAKFDAYVLAHP
jgi:hypothetical protein